MSISTFVASLDAEWRFLADTSEVSWAHECAELEQVTSAGAILERIWGPAADPVLRFLIGRAQDGESLAGRIVVQTMLPKLIQMASRVAGHSPGDALGDLVSQVWFQVQTYPLDRRPDRIAANLYLDARKYAMQLWAWRDAPVDPDDERLTAPSPGVDTVAEAARVLRVAEERGLISPSIRGLLHAVYCEGASSAEAAAEFSTSVASVRYRCSTAIRTRLRPQVSALQDAA